MDIVQRLVMTEYNGEESGDPAQADQHGNEEQDFEHPLKNVL